MIFIASFSKYNSLSVILHICIESSLAQETCFWSYLLCLHISHFMNVNIFCPHLLAWWSPPQCPWVFQNRSLSPSPSSPSKVSSQPSANWIFRKSKSNYSLEKAIHHSWYVHCEGLARSFFSFWFWKFAWTNSITSASFWKCFLAAPPPLTLALLRGENLGKAKETQQMLIQLSNERHLQFGYFQLTLGSSLSFWLILRCWRYYSGWSRLRILIVVKLVVEFWTIWQLNWSTSCQQLNCRKATSWWTICCPQWCSCHSTLGR